MILVILLPVSYKSIRHRDNAEENLSNAKSLNYEKINDLCFNTTTRHSYQATSRARHLEEKKLNSTEIAVVTAVCQLGLFKSKYSSSLYLLKRFTTAFNVNALFKNTFNGIETQILCSIVCNFIPLRKIIIKFQKKSEDPLC